MLNSDRSIVRKVIRGRLSALSSVAEQTSTERVLPLVRRYAEAVETRQRERAKLGEAKSVRRQYFLRRGFFPRRSNFLAVAAAARNRVRILVTENGSASGTAAPRNGRSFIANYYYFAPLSRRRESSDARYIYVYNCAQYAFLPLKIIEHSRRLLIIRARFHRAPRNKRCEKSEHRTSRMQIL